MQVARAYQIPHSALLAWSDVDRDKAIWWEIRQAETCRTCGTRPAEWEPEQGGDRHAYVGHLDTCRGCQAIEDRRAAIPEGHPTSGRHITLVRPRPPEPPRPDDIDDDGQEVTAGEPEPDR